MNLLYIHNINIIVKYVHYKILITSMVRNVKQRNSRHVLLKGTMLCSYFMRILRKYAIRGNQVISVD